MHRILPIMLLSLWCLPFAQAAAGLDLNLNLLVAQKQMSDNEWEGVDLDQQMTYGLMADLNVPLVPFAFALDILTANESSGDFESEIYEVQAGIRKYFSIVPIVTPYAGAGISLLQAELTENGNSVDGTGYGYWFDVGAVYLVADHVNIGVDIRYSSGEVDLEDSYGDVDPGGWMYGAFVGLHF